MTKEEAEKAARVLEQLEAELVPSMARWPFIDKETREKCIAIETAVGVLRGEIEVDG